MPFKPSPTNSSAEMRALDGMLSLTNKIAAESKGLEPPAPVRTVMPRITPDKEFVPKATPDPLPEVGPEPEELVLPAPAQFIPVPAVPMVTLGLRKIFFTGRICAGKDYLAAQANRQIFGFADPLYYLATHFFGVEVTATANKDLPGMREFLQKVGQWGRGTLDAKYPLTTERAIFVTMIRSLAAAGAIAGQEVEWKDFGSTADIWLEAALKRAAGSPNAAITNVRFDNEFKRLKDEGWQHWHIVTSTNEWTTRIAKRGLTPQSPQVTDLSEKLSSALDAQVIKKVSGKQSGPKIHAVWNSSAPAPSPRIYTVAEFLAEVNQ